MSPLTTRSIAVAALTSVAALAAARLRDPSAPSSAPQPTPLASSAAAHPAGPGPVPVGAPVGVQVPARAAARALFMARPDFTAKCWTGLVAGAPSPTRSRHRVRETFGADGKELHREVLDLPGESRADVARCLRDLPLDLHIDPSGVPATVEVTFTFP